MADKEEDGPKLDPNKSPVSTRKAKKLLYLSEFLSKQESRINCKKVSKILKKSAHEHTEDEKETLAKHQDIVKRISKNKEKRELNQQRVLETEDSKEDLQKKCERLAKILQQSKKTVIYTGAGISTAASIPDYRGPQGVWTLLQKGEQLTPQDLSDAEPTLTHMCITQLHKQGHVKHVVSQNCDGLHLRSGLPRQALSEVHGNMFIEICHNCRPHREYVRLFDVTENTGVRRHFTGRHCQKCAGRLKDTIVHFGEKGGVKSPYRWKEAVRAANKCDLILCLGSSLKILKKYACLWCMDRVKHKRPRLVIVNLQWTPKDESATLKINGKCDDVFERVMQILQYSVPQYIRKEDPIFGLASLLTEEESDTTSKKVLDVPSFIPKLRSHGISRTPTPSDSSDSQSSLSSTDSSDSCKGQTSGKLSFDNISLVTGEKKQDWENETKSTAVNCEEMCLSRSERICNEAKIAMQERLVNAKINEMYSVCSNMQGGAFSIRNSGYNGLVMLGQSSVEQQRKMQYDPLQGGPFDPGPSSHDEKVRYLQILQLQLGELKMKQKLLKDQEQQHFKQQKQYCVKQMKTGITMGKDEKKHNSLLNNELKQVSLLKHRSDLFKQENETKKEQTEGMHGKLLASPKHKGISLEQNFTKIKENEISPLKQETCQKIKKSPSTVTKPSIGDFVKASSHPAAFSEHEKKLQQNSLEQTQLKTVLSTMLTNQQKLEEQVRVQHQNEHLRLHQHFLIQEQQRRQSKVGKDRKEEILQLFVHQQQSLLGQQNAVLQNLQQNYILEVKKVQNALQDLKKSYNVNIKRLESMKASVKCPQQKCDIKSPNKLQTAVKLESTESIKGTKMVETLPVSPSLISPKKDHSISTILQGTNSPNRSNTVTTLKIDSAAKNQSKTCESCQFLNGFGMGKKWCAKCEELRNHEGEDQQSLAKTNRVECTFLEHENVPKLRNTHERVVVHESQNEQVAPVYNYVLDLEIPAVEEKKVVQIDFEHNDHNYLKVMKGSEKDRSEVKADPIDTSESIKTDFFSSARHSKGNTVPVSVSTSTSSTVISENENCEKVNPLSNRDKMVSDKDLDHGSQSKNLVMKSEELEKESTRYFKYERDCMLLTKPPEKVTFSLNYEAEEKRKDNHIDTKINDGSETDKNISLTKPVRSHSQSEIYDQEQDDVRLEKQPGVRQIRSHSHSEIDSAKVENEAETGDDIGTEKDSEQSIQMRGKGVSGNNLKTGKKRKISRCLSVPGWFGKGLAIKRRRKY